MSDGHLKDHERHLKRIQKSRGELIDRRDRLIDQIRHVFSATKLDGGISLRQAQAIEEGLSAEKEAEERVLDENVHWTEVKVESVDPGGMCLTWIDPIGFRFYLPAYMTYLLRTGNGLLDDAPHSGWYGHEFLVSTLDASKSDSESRQKHVRSNCACFTKQERTAIARFLAIEAELAIHPVYAQDAVDALRSEWGQYLPPQELDRVRRVWPALFR